MSVRVTGTLISTFSRVSSEADLTFLEIDVIDYRHLLDRLYALHEDLQTLRLECEKRLTV